MERYVNRRVFVVFITFTVTVSITAIAGAKTVLDNPAIIGKEFPYHVYIPKSLPVLFQKILTTIAVGWIALAIVCHDSLIMYLMNQICCQLQVLEIALRELTVATYKTAPIRELITCIQHHQALIFLRNRIEKIFTMMLLLQFFTSLSIIGMTGFQATVTKSASGTQIVIYLYCVCILFELLLYCYFANQVIEEVNISH